MMLFTARITSDRSNIEEILDIFSSVRGQISATSGCMGIRICREYADEVIIVYQEMWQSRERIVKHICSPLFRSIMAAIDMSVKPPEIRFSTIEKAEGMELIREVLDPRSQERA